MPDIRKEVTQDDIDRWLRTLYRRLGIQVVTFRDGANGLVNVPEKYVRVIDHMHLAMVNLAAGDKLPEFLPEEPKKKRTKKK
jgi:hypothetical protein